MSKHITTRLSRDTQYKKNDNSYQANLTASDIKEKLAEYKQIDTIDINSIPLNTHMRYFTFHPQTGEKQFRLGGFLTKIDDEYVVLSNGKMSWSVQKKTAIFFSKMSFVQLKEEIIQKVSKKFEKQISELVNENSKLKDTLKEVKRTIRKKSK